MQITTLVPAFKPQYLNDLLRCLQAQSHKPVRVIISDDSPDGAFVALLAQPQLAQTVAALKIEVVRGPRQGGWANFLHLLGLYGGATPLFHLLMDDDLIYPGFYARHVQAHAQQPAQAVVSRRWYVAEDGLPVGDLPVPEPVALHAARALLLTPQTLFAQVAPQGNNWLGEFSNTTFKADMRPVLTRLELAGLPIPGLEDLGAVLAASMVAPVVYLNEHLGAFRMNAGQHSAQPRGRAFKLGVLAWIVVALAGRRLDYLDDRLLRTAIERAAKTARSLYAQEPDLAALIAALEPLLSQGAEEAFLVAWGDFVHHRHP